MRVLIVHNRYTSRVPSGENLAVDDEVRWLREAGIDVARHEVSNDDIVSPGALARMRDGVEAVWSLSARRRFSRVLDDVEPDVVHVHNLFPLLTASVPAAALRRRIPVVWTVHNFRIRCVAGTNFRDGHPCHDCRRGWKVPGVAHRCYAASASASALVGASTGAFGRLARRRGITPVTISREVANWLVATAGFARAAVRVKYNGVDGPVGDVTGPERQDHLLYLGRLSAEKGVGHLLEAWRHVESDMALHLVGDGPLVDDVRAAAAADPRIVLVGPVPSDCVAEQVLASRALVMPSMWQEPFGRVAAEALAFGRPVITTGRGASSEIVDDASGWVTGVDPTSLARAVDEAAGADDLVAAKGAAGRARHTALFSPEATTATLIDIYAEAIDRAGQAGDGAG
ncbi:MAG TPA: glycosyltransferase family 4 protein [Acidimicrobiales bacterium]